MIQRATLNVSLTPHHRKLVNAAVTSGQFGSASEVVREGLRLLEAQTQRAARIDALRAAIAQGVVEVDRGKTVSARSVFAEIRRRSRARRAAAK